MNVNTENEDANLQPNSIDKTETKKRRKKRSDKDKERHRSKDSKSKSKSKEKRKRRKPKDEPVGHTPPETQPSADSQLFECEICKQRFNVDKLYFLDMCSHRFCNSCLHAYIIKSYKGKPLSLSKQNHNIF
jgi:hypothetical protein